MEPLFICFSWFPISFFQVKFFQQLVFTVLEKTSFLLLSTKCVTIFSENIRSGCADLVNPRTGVSDCPRLAYLCNNAAYYQLMTQQCPRTCNRCSQTTPGPVTPASPANSSKQIAPALDYLLRVHKHHIINGSRYVFPE